MTTPPGEEESTDEIALTYAHEWYNLEDAHRQAFLDTVAREPDGPDLVKKMLIHVAVLVLFKDWPREVVQSLSEADRATVEEILNHDAEEVNSGSLSPIPEPEPPAGS